MQQRCVVIGRRSPGELAAVVLVLVALLAAVVAAPAAAVPAAARPPRVTASDALVVWDGTRETFALRWHLSAPVTRVDWLVAVPARTRAAQVAPDALATFADVAAPRDRWVVTHPWLLVGDEGARARDHLASALAPAPAGVRSTTTPDDEADGAEGADGALRAAAAAGVPVDAVTRQWAAAATLRGWQVRLVTVTVPEPSTVVGPVALDLPAAAPVVPATAWPRGGDLTLVTVAATVLAPDQPDVVLAGRSVPALTVENARTLRADVADVPALAGRVAPAGGWVVTALAGRQLSEATVLVPQSGAIRDWRTQVGVWWPGWGTAALTVLTVLAAVALGVVVSRRRARAAAARPARAVPAPAVPAPAVAVVPVPAPSAEADTLTDLTTVGEDDLVDTRPDLGPVRAGVSPRSQQPRP